MLTYLANWVEALPGDAIALELVMLGLTLALVRSSMHPTTFALLAWPGTVAHESAHGLVGLLLGAKPCEVSLIPKQNPNGGWTLGYVAFANMRWWNGPPTAMAPLMLAPLAVWLVADWVYPWFQAGFMLEAAWRLALCSLLFQASWPSGQDFKVATPGFIVLGFLYWGLDKL